MPTVMPYSLAGDEFESIDQDKAKARHQGHHEEKKKHV